MHRCSGYDAHFIYDERPDEPQHTLKIAVLSPEASAAHAIGAARREVQQRLRSIPPLRWRALRVPLDLHHPVWIDVGEVDVERHVRRLALPAPGGRQELCEVISEIASHALDPARPLWELWVLEGYEGSRVVWALKMSHALADGGESRELVRRLFPHEAETVELPSLEAEPVPSRTRLVVDALRDVARDLVVEVPRLLRATRRSRARIRAARREGRAPEPPRVSPLASPPTPFAGPLGRRRSFHFATLSLDQALEIRRRLGGTVNDVVVATTAGAVRSYLAHRGGLPDGPTLGLMPASIRTESERGAWGNRLTVRPMELPTHLADPVERLCAARRAGQGVKADVALRQGAQLEDWERALPPFVPKTVSILARSVARLRPELPAGVVISNVVGPRQALHTLGGPVENFVSVGHMKYMAGLNVTVWSYTDRLNFALYTCADAVPDLWLLSDFMAESFEELYKAATRPAGSPATRPRGELRAAARAE